MRTTVCCLAFSLAVLLAAEQVSAVTIGGSVLRSPPQYQLNSFLVGLGGTRQEAYPFQVISGGDWTIDALDVPLYHYDGMAGSSEAFSICADDSGHPGDVVATFSTSSITTTQRVYSLTPTSVTGTLEGGATYWIVGSNVGGGQVNWNMDESVGNFTRAYRVDSGDWTIQSGLSNISAFAIEGSAVGVSAPEPSSMVLLGIGAVGLLAYAWRRRAV